MNSAFTTPMLFPYDPDKFWDHLRLIVREEIVKKDIGQAGSVSYETPGLTYKPLLKIAEVCGYFMISRPTVYEWIKDGKLKPYKIRRRVYFLWNDVQELLKA